MFFSQQIYILFCKVFKLINIYILLIDGYFILHKNKICCSWSITFIIYINIPILFIFENEHFNFLIYAPFASTRSRDMMVPIWRDDWKSFQIYMSKFPYYNGSTFKILKLSFSHCIITFPWYSFNIKEIYSKLNLFPEPNAYYKRDLFLNVYIRKSL